MKNIYLKCYYNNNLGDDLFIYMLSKRYHNRVFKTLTYNNCLIKDCDNINVYCYKKNRLLKILNKTIKIITFKNYDLEYVAMKKSKYIILLGGSMFIESNHKKIKKDKKILNKLYILGTNFGPYNSEEFKGYYKEVFSAANDVCFREKYSYDLFEDLKNVRYTCDMVFGLDTSSIKITNKKNVIISVIDCTKKQNKENTEKYEQTIVNLIKKFYSLNYNITLMSFCKNEGDEEAISRILSKIDDKKIKNKIKQYNYNGNIDEALNVLGNSQIIIGSRFHANIVGMVLGKTILPIAYSDKTINTLKDIDYKGKIIDIRNLDNFNIDEITEKDLKYKMNIDKYRKESEKHFEELDKLLK